MGFFELLNLFEPGWKSANEEKALRSLSKVKGDEALYEVAKNAYLTNVRLAAVKRIEDEDYLKRLAIGQTDRLYNDTHPIAAAATKRLNSQEALEEIFLTSRYSDVVEAAKNRLAQLYPKAFKVLRRKKEDAREEKLLEIVTTSNDPTERIRAVMETNRDSTVVKALNDKDINVCIAAINKIKDQGAFVGWLGKSKREIPIGSSQLYKKIDTLNEGSLRKIVDNDTIHVGIRKHACTRLGHIRGEGCTCSCCGAKMEHEFNDENVCIHCGARLVEKTETLVKDGVAWGRQTNRTVTLPDGTKEELGSKLEKLVDESTLNWLFPSD